MILTKVTRERMIMLVLEDVESEVGGVGHINTTIKVEQTIRGKGPVGLSGSWEMRRGDGIRGEGGEDVLVELLLIKGHSSSEHRSNEVGCSEGHSKLFL